jgi:HSP20 family protein
MQITTWKPFQEMENFFSRYSPQFDMRLGASFDKEGHNIAEWTPSADISETKKEYLVKAELPDVDKKDIHVTVSDGTLKIEGERRHEKEEEDETYHRVESFYGKFSRSFVLPSDADEKKIKADSKNGVLRVHLPKTEEKAEDKSVDIEVA